MKVINTKVHGVLDYLVGVLLIGSPWLFGFFRGGLETSVPMMLGVGTILYSLITDYELGIAKALSMKTHLVLDIACGLFLIASPWLFGFRNIVFLPHVIIGIAEVAVVSLSYNVAYQDHKNVLGM